MSFKKILNDLGILDANQQQQLSAEVIALRRANVLLKQQNQKLTGGHLAIIDYARRTNSNKSHEQLMEWHPEYALSMTALSYNKGRAEAANAISLSHGNDPKQRTGQKASAAQEAVRQRRSPQHTDPRQRRRLPA